MVLKRGERKGQITLFVILALLLLVIVAVVLVIRNNMLSDSDDFDEPIPEDFKPVSDYVTNCIHLLGVEAVKRMGAHGGYLDPADTDYTPIGLKFIPTRPTISDMVSLTGEKGDAVPYYLHIPGNMGRYNYYPISAAPTIDMMQLQINHYINTNLPDCLGDFSALEERGFNVVTKNVDITTQALIHDKDIDVHVEHHINVTKGGVVVDISKYTTIIKFPYKKYYDMAKDIRFREMNTQFLEMFSTSLISYYSGVEVNRLPPFVGFSRDPYQITWMKPKVSNDYNGLLLSYIPALQVRGTEDYSDFESGTSIEDKFYNSLAFDLYEEEDYSFLERTSITFFYPDRSVNLNVNPSTGQMIGPGIKLTDTGSPVIPKTTLNTYKFFYDIEYPVIVEIRGKEPESEIQEFSFLFAMEANMLNNKPWLAWLLGFGTIYWDPAYMNVTLDFDEQALIGYTGPNPNAGNAAALQSINARAGKSLMCNENNMISGEISVRVEDAFDNPLDEAFISFICGDYDVCWMGTTQMDDSGAFAEWKGKLPICEGGYFSITKDGYATKLIPLSTKLDKDEWLATQELEKIMPVNITVKKRVLVETIYRDIWEWKRNNQQIGSVIDIDDINEQVILTMEQIDVPISQAMANVAVFGNDGDSIATFNLVPGKYEVTATLIDYTGLTIPKECGQVEQSNTLIPAVPIEFEILPWGGVVVNRTTMGLIELNRNQLQTLKEIEFKVLKLPDLRLASPAGGCLEHINEMNRVGEYSKTYSGELQPVFK